MGLSGLLTHIHFQVDEQPLVAIDPQTRFAIMAAGNGPERVDSAFRRVLVAVHDWQALGVNEDEEIVKVLVEASASNPLKVSTPAGLDETFWVKNQKWKALLCNPGLLGKFLIPEGPIMVASENVAMNQLVLVGTPAMAGFFVHQGARRGVLSNHVHGLMQIQFFAV